MSASGSRPVQQARITEVRRAIYEALAVGLFLGLVVLASFRSYLLFHGLAEMFSVAVVAGVFMISWNSRDFEEDRAIVYLGIGYLFAALVDVLHTLTYQGMALSIGTSDTPTKLWLAARLLQAVGLLFFAGSLHTRRSIPYGAVFAVGAALTVALLASILVWPVFPSAFIEGVGLTAFKNWSEYALCALFATSMILIALDRSLPRDMRQLLAVSSGLTVLSELSFTLYTSPYGAWNMAGHLVKIVAFYLIYRALVAGEVRRRIALIRRLQEARDAALESERVLRETNAAKDKFFSIIAHDMRNPLSGVHMLATMLADRYEELPEERRRNLGRLIADGSERGLALMESLLMWARAQTGRLPFNPRPFDVAGVAEEAIALMRGAIEGKGISVTCSTLPGLIVHADRDMVLAVLRNLLSNAVKFTARGGNVSFEARVNHEFVELAVQDTGVGIEPPEVEKLFRIDAHVTTPGTESEGGAGLGLILCREFVERNGGRIRVQSTPGAGSRFVFTLPRAAPQQSPARPG